MLLIVTEYPYEDQCLNYQGEIVQKISFDELRMKLEMNEPSNNHFQLKIIQKKSSNRSVGNLS
jgi:hypothetical protein